MGQGEKNRFGLNEGQIEILDLLCEDLSNSEIARRLSLSEDGVKMRFRGVYKALNVQNRTEAAAKYTGLIGISQLRDLQRECEKLDEEIEVSREQAAHLEGECARLRKEIDETGLIWVEYRDEAVESTDRLQTRNHQLETLNEATKIMEIAIHEGAMLKRNVTKSFMSESVEASGIPAQVWVNDNVGPFEFSKPVDVLRGIVEIRRAPEGSCHVVFWWRSYSHSKNSPLRSNDASERMLDFIVLGPRVKGDRLYSGVTIALTQWIKPVEELRQKGWPLNSD